MLDLLLLFIALLHSINKAIVDVILFKYPISIFRNIDFFDNSESWKNKWKLNHKGQIIPNHQKIWYYLFLYKPKYIERFPFSSTILVFLTDGFHLFDSIRNLCLYVSVSLMCLYYNYILPLNSFIMDKLNFMYINSYLSFCIYLLIIRIIHGVVFELLYSKLLIKKNNQSI